MECLLHFGGFVQLSVQSYVNRVERKTSGEYRILCIGGSTTYNGGPVNSYPAQLEKVLNESQTDISYRVINKGLPAQGTTHILYELEDNINTFEPDMVIAMMGGVNEVGLSFVVADTPMARFKFLVLDRIKTYRLLKKLAKDAIEYLKNYKVSKKISTDFYKFENNKSISVSDKSKSKDFELLESDQKQNTQKKSIIDQIKNEKDSDQVAIEAPKPQINEEIKMTSLEVPKIQISEKIVKSPRQILKGDSEHSSTQYKMITDYHPLTKRNLNDASEMVLVRGIRMVFMQYALMDIEPLKESIYSREKVIFVSNKSNFEKAIQNESYEGYIDDHWGHLTPLGNNLVARTLAPIIKREAMKQKAQ